MSEGSYYFDPTEIDNLDEDGEESLDNWKPKAKKQELTQSEWRKNQIGDNFNQEPGLDDLDKIHSLIRKKAPDSEIMRVFGINAHTLIAIKERRYCPVDGISLNNLSKIHAEFNKVERRADRLWDHILMIFGLIFPDGSWQTAYKKYSDINKKERKAKEKVQRDKKTQKKLKEKFEDKDEEE